MRFSLDLVAIYLFKFNNGNARAMIEIFFFLYQGMIEICSKSIVKTSELRHCSGVFVIDFEQLNGGWLIDLSKISDRADQRPLSEFNQYLRLGQVYKRNFDRKVLKFLKISKFENFKNVTILMFMLEN